MEKKKTITISQEEYHNQMELITNLLMETGRGSNTDEILFRDVTQYGNSCHLSVPSKHKGKKAKIIIFKENENNEYNLDDEIRKRGINKGKK